MSELNDIMIMLGELPQYIIETIAPHVASVCRGHFIGYGMSEVYEEVLI